MKKNIWSSPDLITKKILFIDGLTRAGKSMVGPVVSSLSKTYPMQSQEFIDKLMPILSKKEIDKNIVRSLIVSFINQNIYNINISRSINLRPGDYTSFVNDKNYLNFIKNLKKKEGDHVIDQIKRKNLWLIYATHDLLSMLNSFNKLDIPYKIIYTYRHPVDNIFSLFARTKNRLKAFNKLKYNLNHPRAYSMMIKHNGILLPYYSEKKENFFLKLNFAEKSAFYYFNKMYKSIQEFKKNKKNIYLLRYDDFALNPNKEIKKICNFLSSKKTKFTKKSLRLNKLPRQIDIKKRKEKKAILKKIIKKDFFKKLEVLSDKYDRKVLF